MDNYKSLGRDLKLGLTDQSMYLLMIGHGGFGYE